MFTMARRQLWEHNWFVMAHSKVYLHAVMDSYGHVFFTALLFCYYYPWVSAPVCLYAYIYS